MRLLLPLCCTLLFVACSGEPEKTGGRQESAETVHSTGAADTLITNARPMVLAGCYEMTMKRDTAFLDLQVQDSTVSGRLTFKFFEKDRNDGTLRGVVRDSLILADYTFQSEGTTSVRQVVFKISEDALVQGYGELTEEGTRLVFTHPDQLQFPTINPFMKVPCEPGDQ